VLKFHGTVVIGDTLDDMNFVAAELEIAARAMMQAAAIRAFPILAADEIAQRQDVMATPAVRRIRSQERARQLRDYHSQEKP